MSAINEEKPLGGLTNGELTSAAHGHDTEGSSSPVGEKDSASHHTQDEEAALGSNHDQDDVDTDNEADAGEGLADMSVLYATRSWVEDAAPPDGGVTAWTQVAMGWIVIFATWGYVNSFGAFQTHYTQILGVSASDVSWIGSIQTWLTFVIGAFSGRALDAGFLVPTIAVGATVQLLGIFLMSISTEYWHLMLTQGVITGIGGGIIFTPCLALVATYFQNHRALAVGLATTGNSAGGMVYPAVVRELLPTIGFAWTARVLGFINMAGFAVVIVFMRSRLKPRKSGAIIDWTAFREPVYVAYVAGLFFFVWAVYYTLYYVSPSPRFLCPAYSFREYRDIPVLTYSQIASFATETLDLPYSEATLLVTIVNGVGLPARVLTPLLADPIGPLNIIAPAGLCLAIIAYCWVAVDSVPGHYVFTVFYGVASGAFQCLMPTGVASITKRLDKVGTRLGMCFSILSFAGLTGPPLGGALQATANSFKAPQAWAATSTLICAALLFTARFLKTGPKLKVKC